MNIDTLKWLLSFHNVNMQNLSSAVDHRSHVMMLVDNIRASVDALCRDDSSSSSSFRKRPRASLEHVVTLISTPGSFMRMILWPSLVA